MRVDKTNVDRLAAYSDAVFAVIVTIVVLELRVPDQPGFLALWPLWPTAISYAVSYLFIAIVWINHDYLMRFVSAPTPRLIWINFAHLFLVSLLPFATAWVARTRLASSAVALCAGLFVCVDIACNVFERDVLTHADGMQGIRRCSAYGQAPITACPRGLHDRYAAGVHRAATRLRSDLLRADSPCAAGGFAQSAVTVPRQTHTSPRERSDGHRSTTTSGLGPVLACPWADAALVPPHLRHQG